MLNRKRVLVHCSTNWNTSNFGDMLFAEMIIKYLNNKRFCASLYDTSAFTEKYIYEEKKEEKCKFNVAKADGCIYFAGGYFGENKDDKLLYKLIHFKRFMLFGLSVLFHRKKIAVIGIGAGPYLWLPSRMIVRRICMKAYIVTTRDQESTVFLHQIGVNREVVTCSDIAQTLEKKDYTNQEIDFLDEDKEYVFIHTNNEVDVAELFSKGLYNAVKNNPNMMVIVGNDYLMDIDNAFRVARKNLGDRVIKYQYKNPDELCFILSMSSLVLTFKLHVGILASTFGCSVISAYKHKKIPRYFKQISEEKRCVAFEEATPEIIEKMVEQYGKIKICIPDEIKKYAENNWMYLDRFLETI